VLEATLARMRRQCNRSLKDDLAVHDPTAGVHEKYRLRGSLSNPLRMLFKLRATLLPAPSRSWLAAGKSWTTTEEQGEMTSSNKGIAG
jgi:hypothetical protein